MTVIYEYIWRWSEFPIVSSYPRCTAHTSVPDTTITYVYRYVKYIYRYASHIRIQIRQSYTSTLLPTLPTARQGRLSHGSAQRVIHDSHIRICGAIVGVPIVPFHPHCPQPGRASPATAVSSQGELAFREVRIVQLRESAPE